MRFLFNKKKTGEIVIVDDKPGDNRQYNGTKPGYSFSPSGGFSFVMMSGAQIKKALGKNSMNWNNGGKKIFMQAVFYPASIGNTREDRNEYLESILQWELES